MIRSSRGSEDPLVSIMKQRVLLALANLITSYASFLAATGPRASTRQRTQSNNHGNISELLDNLLRGYDNSVRPDFGGPPATVEVDIMVRSMGPISEVDMTYSMDCYFRQSWVDRRLAFQGNKEHLALSISMLQRIWKPDTYFYNGKHSYLHTITSPNKFVRLYKDGRVLYSSRLTIKAGCPMNLEDFPMDTQRCPLKFGSFGYTTRDVIYRWNTARQVAISKDMKLSQFDLVANPTANQSTEPSLAQISPVVEEYSMLLVSFHLQRHMGNFLIQVYGPCVLLVVLSWVSFWLNREATADRVSLGITTVLTMTFLGLEARTDLPKVPYPTALDFFVFLSFAFIFATIIQFAVVHYFTKYGSGECYFSSDISESDNSSDEETVCRPRKKESSRRKSSGNSSQPNKSSGGGGSGNNRNFPMSDDGVIEVIQLSALPEPDRNDNGQWQLSCVPRQPPPPKPRVPSRRRHRRVPRYNSVSKIDRASRVVFPLFFLTINVFYWYAYLSRSERISYYHPSSS
ncbi:gamma-aminobutyric acid receptor alpha-like isoform X1 [Leptopilina heterotoma]|uniref:gamma-aminobutyric acid receptor alpha-like isoform X1 n=1 Tax=Leptopilina heterotoma TaxID=63436 RepID=UPI001CA8E41D|nr:gamma-aminobutyric acid receptor alpha-like isoform X1 [Leptopilina heterotoma]XP_043483254.1 gamma-aminobutyric acid receptor alpha-like isoform X1 [Leptopilina heterotoma]XP_043483255.1 gamma-aminobutyric acid receptor alpha-like isoform X1 [Leptopilina heterotoma]XP_043483256.1 gamma-aminobutyric acid receptor alpha-like isoform X1 [Leptopilina heterotoma]XP_043483257.1 gamma-aminobutyric acid receptor alpha-like isoform X1 [Leptopilina heterotoma]